MDHLYFNFVFFGSIHRNCLHYFAARNERNSLERHDARKRPGCLFRISIYDQSVGPFHELEIYTFIKCLKTENGVISQEEYEEVIHCKGKDLLTNLIVVSYLRRFLFKHLYQLLLLHFFLRQNIMLRVRAWLASNCWSGLKTLDWILDPGDVLNAHVLVVERVIPWNPYHLLEIVTLFSVSSWVKIKTIYRKRLGFLHDFFNRSLLVKTLRCFMPCRKHELLVPRIVFWVCVHNQRRPVGAKALALCVFLFWCFIVIFTLLRVWVVNFSTLHSPQHLDFLQGAISFFETRKEVFFATLH